MSTSGESCWPAQHYAAALVEGSSIGRPSKCQISIPDAGHWVRSVSVDLAGETAATTKLYGLDQPATEVFGRQCLLARRLIERGVRLVQLYHITGGMVYGQTDEFGWDVIDNRVHVHDLHATILHLLGLDHQRLTYRFGGRDYRLTDVYGDVVTGILA
jgi:hypothetical protein